METQATIFTGKRTEMYSGSTDIAGDFAVVFAQPYSSAPGVFPVATSSDSMLRLRVVSATASGFTVRAEKNATVTVLTIDVLSLGIVPQAGVPVRVFVTEG